MPHAKHLVALLLAAAPLGACTQTGAAAGPLTAVNNPSMYSVHQPVVERTDFVLDLDATGDTLSTAERDRLIAWFDAIELRYGDQLYVGEPASYGSPGARAAIASLVGEYGMTLQAGAPVTQGNVEAGRVRMIASRASASVPGCPNWEEPLYPTSSTSPDFGCATNSNLAAMVANPNDLVRGRAGSVGASGATATRAVRVYLGRAPTGAQGINAESSTGR